MSLSGIDFARQQALFCLQEYAGKFNKREIPIPVPVEQIAERCFGLRIERSQLPSGISGQLFVADKVIVLNSVDPLTRQRFTTGHELGHFCLHRQADGNEQCPGPRSSDKEREADHFSASLLLPTNLVLLAVADEVNAAVQMAKREDRVYDLTGAEMNIIAQRVALNFIVSRTVMTIFLSKRYAVKGPTQMGLHFGIDTA